MSSILGRRRREPYSNQVFGDVHANKRRRTDEGKSTNLYTSIPLLLQQPEIPWHVNDRFLSRLNEHEFKSLIQPQNLPNYPFGDDNQTVHILFQPLLFSMPRLCQPFLAALRLASRFLNSKYTLTFFHSLMFNQLTPLQEEAAYYNTPAFHTSESKYRHTGLPASELIRTKQMLMALFPHIRFQLNSSPMPDSWAVTQRAESTSNSYPTPLDIYQTSDSSLARLQNLIIREGFQGTNAVINIDPTLLQILSTNITSIQSYTQTMSCAYFLAITLCHELSHAIYMTRVPDPIKLIQFYPNLFQHKFDWSINQPEDLDPFYHNDRRPELGHAWESSIFQNGTIIPSGTTSQNFISGLGWYRWPTSFDKTALNPRNIPVAIARLYSIPENYKYNTGGITSLINPQSKVKLAPRLHGRWETMYVIPFQWIYRQFTFQFWNNHLKSLKEFEPNRSLGVRLENINFSMGPNGIGVVINSEDENCFGFDINDEGFRKSISVGAVDDKGYPSSEGVIRPGQTFIPFPIDSESSASSNSDHDMD